MTKYFDQIEDGSPPTNTTGGDGGNNDAVMSDRNVEVGPTGGDRQTSTTVASRNSVKHHRNYGGRAHQRSTATKMPYAEKIWVPKAMKNLMLSTTANSTSIHFGMGHMYHRHNKLFTLEHIE